MREGRLDLDLEDVALPQSELEVALPPAVEVFFSIHGEGETPTLVISPAGFVTSRGGVFGRFAYIDERFHQMLRALAEEEVHRYPDYAFAEVVYSDRVGHHTNVALHPSLYPYQIAVGVAPSVPFERQIPLSELMVGVDGQRFYVYSPSLDRIVLPRAPHVLNPQLAPNSVRFLREVGEQGLAVVPTWQWGPLSTLPFLPRVRLGQVVLAPARWRLPRPLPRDLGALDRWRAQWQVPRYVYIGSHDNRLLLDLDHPACFELLRREAPEYVEEAPDPHSAWVSGGSGHHMAEYVLRLPLGSAGESYPQRAARSVQSLDPVRRMRFPGQRVIYLKLYGPATFQNDILFALHQFLKEHGSPNWFFVRYQDPDDHLRVRIFGKEGELGEFLSRFSREAHRYAENGFLLRWATDTYEPEFERYGGEAGLAVCEEIFCVETRALLDLFALKPPLPLRELALFSVDGLLEGLGIAQGYLDLGLAHGIPGPLALLSLAWGSGLREPGMEQAAALLVRRIQQTLRETPYGPDVPYRQLPILRQSPEPSRTGWCYGNPGVARALQLAARSFAQPDWAALARELVRSAIRRPIEIRGLAAPTFCHGLSGFLAVLLHFETDLPSDEWKEAVNNVIDRMFAHYEPNTAFGFQNQEVNLQSLDDPSLQTGAAGVALVLLAASGMLGEAWDAVFLLA